MDISQASNLHCQWGQESEQNEPQEDILRHTWEMSFQSALTRKQSNQDLGFGLKPPMYKDHPQRKNYTSKTHEKKNPKMTPHGWKYSHTEPPLMRIMHQIKITCYTPGSSSLTHKTPQLLRKHSALLSITRATNIEKNHKNFLQES